MQDVYYAAVRFVENYLYPRAVWWNIKAFFQRRIRGFDDSEVWSLDDTILKFILPRLKRFREKDTHAWPGALTIFEIDHDDYMDLSPSERNDLDERSLEEWGRMLDKMIRAIELKIEHGGIYYVEHADGSFEFSEALEAEANEGWALFIEWFHALWD